MLEHTNNNNHKGTTTMKKTITCYPRQVIDHVHHDPARYDRTQVRNHYERVHSMLTEDGICMNTEPVKMMLKKVGPKFQITFY